VLVRADHAEDLPSWNVFLAGRSATCLAFERDDFVAILAPAFARKHGGVHVIDPTLQKVCFVLSKPSGSAR